MVDSVTSKQLSIVVTKEIDGLEMGVLSDGTAYLSGRALAILCDVVPSAIINQSDNWAKGQREGKLAQLIASRGMTRPRLHLIEIDNQVGGGKVYAYDADVCTTFLEYYAFDAPGDRAKARENFRKLAHASLQLFVYRSVGYDPANQMSKQWRQLHARLTTHAVPFGFFSVFRELSEFMVSSIQRGLPCDDRTIPDISVGQIWSAYWAANNFDVTLGSRKKHKHNYPDEFPQSYSNPQDIWIYPVAAVPAFRTWLAMTYIPEKFPAYLKGKQKSGALPPSTVELLLAEVVAPAQLAAAAVEPAAP
jgi:hypothetical protein